ncbi:MAG TPA: ATP-binding protein [Bryobacteraceae bacterium]|nr:ATP-binding protein [Bryobacteraceae bacterium]
MPEPSKDDPVVARPGVLRSLSSKFSLFTATLVFWVVATILAYDMRQENFDVGKGVLLCLIVILVSGAISRFTIRLLARPLRLLQEGIIAVRNGRLEQISVSRTGDEVEFLGDSFNKMIEALAVSRREIQQHQELLEQRIKERTQQLEQATSHAQAASQAKSNFLASVSHELRTPVNGIIGMIDMAMDNQLPPEQAEELQTAQSCAQSLMSLLNEILDLSKIEAGKMTLERVPFEVRVLVADCLKEQQPRVAQTGVALRCEISPEVPQQVVGDPLRIRQILSNLLSNAVKFTGQGSVSVRVESELSDTGGCSLRITVEDTGTGIPADKLNTIFEEFTQADGSVSRKYGGTGLGLAITKKLVEMHGGQVQVLSEVGRGTTFVVTLVCELNLEAAANRERAAVTVREKPAVAALSPGRILIVEDNQVNQKVVTSVLRKRGYFIELANDGQEALSKLESNDGYDLVLMDVQMPVLDGLETTRLIRKDPRWRDLPVVAMTAHAMNGDKEKCLAAGMSGYISKPVHPAHLLLTVDEFIRPLARPVTP